MSLVLHRARALVASALAAACALAQGAPTEAEVRAEVEVLDRAVEARDVEAYLARFAPEQPFLHELHGRVLRGRLAAAPKLSRTSEIRSVAVVGDHAVAVVAQETGTSGDAAPLMCEYVLFAFRRLQGRVRPVLAAEVPEPDFDARAVVCSFCNYRVGPAEGWLALPVATSRAAAVEGTVFVRLGADLAVEVHVQVADRVQDAAAFLEPLAAVLLRGAPGATAAAAGAWEPGAFAVGGGPLTAARQLVSLPDDRAVDLRAVAMGRLAHLFTVRGPRAALERHAADVERLFATYRLFSTEPKVHEQAAVAIEHHCGGLLLGSDYKNPRHGVSCSGPEGWAGLERCSGFLFEVDFSAPENAGRVRVRGIAPPPGAMRWETEAADRWLADLCRRARVAVDTGADTGWLTATGGFVQRTLTLLGDDGNARELRLLLRVDQLVVADGTARTAATAEAVRAAVRSLTPER